MTVPAQQKPAVGYFVSISVDDFVFIGGAMVTDKYGLPIEFRYTEPVRANRLQRVLYGDVLERFIHTDVILTNLIERMEQKPSLFIVSDASFLIPVSGTGVAGVWLGETRAPRLSVVGEIQPVSVDEFLIQLIDNGSPTRVRLAPASDTAADRVSSLAAQLVELSKTMDVLEPLSRIDTAIKLIWEEAPENPLLPVLEAR